MLVCYSNRHFDIMGASIQYSRACYRTKWFTKKSNKNNKTEKFKNSSVGAKRHEMGLNPIVNTLKSHQRLSMFLKQGMCVKLWKYFYWTFFASNIHTIEWIGSSGFITLDFFKKQQMAIYVYPNRKYIHTFSWNRDAAKRITNRTCT